MRSATTSLWCIRITSTARRRTHLRRRLVRVRRRRLAAARRVRTRLRRDAEEDRCAEAFRRALDAPICSLLQLGVQPAFVQFGPVVVHFVRGRDVCMGVYIS